MTYLFGTTFFHKTAFDVPVSTNDKQYLIFLAGKFLKFGTQKILRFMEYFLGENLKLVSAIFYKIFISHKMIALEKL